MSKRDRDLELGRGIVVQLTEFLVGSDTAREPRRAHWSSDVALFYEQFELAGLPPTSITIDPARELRGPGGSKIVTSRAVIHYRWKDRPAIEVDFEIRSSSEISVHYKDATPGDDVDPVIAIVLAILDTTDKAAAAIEAKPQARTQRRREANREARRTRRQEGRRRG
jgi:hypothetical protein